MEVIFKVHMTQPASRKARVLAGAVCMMVANLVFKQEAEVHQVWSRGEHRDVRRKSQRGIFQLEHLFVVRNAGEKMYEVHEKMERCGRALASVFTDNLTGDFYFPDADFSIAPKVKEVALYELNLRLTSTEPPSSPKRRTKSAKSLNASTEGRDAIPSA